MAEINNNISNFGINNKKVENKFNKEVVIPQAQSAEEGEIPHYVQDTGVLGRSQVKCAKCGDIPKSVDEAVALAKNHPEILEAGEMVFDSIYEAFLTEGLDPADAYAQASLAVDEFCEMALSR